MLSLGRWPWYGFLFSGPYLTSGPYAAKLYCMLTMTLSEIETRLYCAAVRAALRENAAKRAYVAGKRFYQIRGVDGRVLDVGEVQL